MAASENNICLLFVYFSLNLFEISLNSLLVRSSLRKFRYVEMPPYPERKTEPSHSRPFPRNPCLHVQLYDPLVLLQKASRLHRPFSTLINVWKNQALKGLKKSNCESACNLHACYYLFQFEELIFWLGSCILLTTKWHPFVQELVCLTTDNVQLINSKFYTLNCFSHP